MTSSEARAYRLLRWYPRVWRDRHGEELVWLLVEDIEDRPRCLRRDFDVVQAGLTARLSACGLANGPVRDEPAARTTAAVAIAAFAAGAASIWTQLARGAVGGTPTQALTLGLLMLSLGWLVVAATGLVAAIAFARAGARTVRAGRGRPLLRPAGAVAGSAAFIIGGAIYMASTASGAVPASASGPLAGITRVGWGLTDSISTFWVHPARLLALPSYELAWMLVSPLAAIAFVRGLLTLAHVVGLPAPSRRRRIIPIVLLPMFVAAATWVIGSQYGDSVSYRAGTLDLALVLVMLLAATATRASSLRRG